MTVQWNMGAGQWSLRVANARAPILRAGWLNMSLPSVPIFGILGFSAMKQWGAGGSAWVGAAVGVAIALWLYGRMITGVSIEDGCLVVEHPVGQRAYSLATVERVLMRSRRGGIAFELGLLSHGRWKSCGRMLLGQRSEAEIAQLQTGLRAALEPLGVTTES